MANALFPEIDVEVVKLVLTKKDGSATVTYYFAMDYWASGTIYTTNPEVLPLLAASPEVHRGVGIYAGIRYDVSIDLYAKTSMTEAGKSFGDTLDAYELHNADAQILYYSKPIGAVTTHSDNVNIRQVLKVIDVQYSDDGAMASIRCRDVPFKDKEVSKKLTSADFSNLDIKLDGEYGAIAFGQSSVAGEGVVIDAPFIYTTAPAGLAVARNFAGWNFAGVSAHSTKAVDRILLRNQHPGQVTSPYVQVNFASAGGETVITPVVDPANWPRDLSRYARGVVVTPSANDGRILTGVGFGLQRNEFDRCADIIDGQHLYNNANPDFLSAGDVDLTVEIWVNPDLLHNAGGNRIICAQGDVASGTLEWMLGWDVADDKAFFGISVNGTTIATSVKTVAAQSASTWYQFVVQHDKTGNAVGIYVNNAAVATASTGANVMTRRNGPFHIGANIAGDLGFDGKAYMFRYWNRLITGGDVGNLYNSGSPVFTSVVSDTIAAGMRCSIEMNEPYGLRKDAKGSADLTEGSNSTSLSQVISYGYNTAKTLSFLNEKGQAFCSVYLAQTTDGGLTYLIQGTALRRMPIDMNTQVTTTGGDALIIIDPPLVLNPGGAYLVALEGTNHDTNSYFIRTYYDSHAGSTHYALDVRRSDQNWAKQTDVRLWHDLWYGYDAGLGLSTATTLVTLQPYSYYAWERPVWTANSPNTDKVLDNELDFKLGVKGLKDDTSGTYTGSVGAVIENGSDIIRFTYMNADFGLGLTSAVVDTATLDAVRSSLSTAGIALKIVIDRETSADQLINEICRQSRIVNYKKRNGKLALYYPAPISSYTAALSQAVLGGELQLAQVSDDDYSTVVNQFRQYYKPDVLNQATDPATLRKSEREKLAGLLEITATRSTSGDTYRQGLCSTSQSKYGLREMTGELSFHDSATVAQKIQNYYCDRYSTLQKRVTIKVPRRSYHNTLDLFDTVRVSHVGIAAEAGTGIPTKQHYQGTPIVTYSENVPVLKWSGGVINGQIYEVQEQGPWMILTAETVSNFNT